MAAHETYSSGIEALIRQQGFPYTLTPFFPSVIPVTLAVFLDQAFGAQRFSIIRMPERDFWGTVSPQRVCRDSLVKASAHNFQRAFH
jgi:hypothetical protein